MPDGYDTHADYIGWVKKDASARSVEMLDALRDAFGDFLEVQEIEVIRFSAMTALDLAKSISKRPKILKPLMACCNVAPRAIERDLDIRGIDSYAPSLSDTQAAAIAGYLKPFLPRELALPALGELDRHFFVDKEIRARKGQWEKTITKALNSASGLEFKKRKFKAGKDSFEIDAAYPTDGPIKIAVDVKRIEARRDIHKRIDEIVNKALKFKRTYPRSVFAAVIYYPFDEQANIKSRLKSSKIDAVSFASQGPEQIATAIGLLVGQLGISTKKRQ